jgi:beta-1,4-mannosyltransferase
MQTSITRSPEPLRVAFLPVYQNPYQHLLTAALRQLGIDVLHLEGMPSPTWLLRERQRVQVLHLHWLYGLYMRHFLTPFRLLGFLGQFALARCLGYKIVWTVHNILPHRQPFPPMHHLVRRLVMKQADAVIAHCEYGRREVLRCFPREKPVHVIPIGGYGGVYPATVSREEARDSLGLEADQFVYLFLANISANKGLESFVRVFQEQASETDVALIAGRNRNQVLVDRLEAVAASDARLRIHAGFIPDDAMQLFLRAADVMVAPFQEILTSSSVMVGMSYGLPVIVPAMGCLTELVTPEAGIVYEANDPAALGHALRQIKGMDTIAMGGAAERITASLSWAEIAAQTAAVYRGCLR